MEQENKKPFDPDGVGQRNGAYFGFDVAPAEAAVVLLSAPWDVTVSYGAGTAKGPAGILEASTQLDFYDAAAPDAWRKGIATGDRNEDLIDSSWKTRVLAEQVIRHLENGGSQADVASQLVEINAACAALNERIYRQSRSFQGQVVGLVGGDHSTPYGLIKAQTGDFGILHLDAHCDLRPAYEGFEWSHASVMHNVLRDVKNVKKLVQVGVRDFSAAEAATAAADPRIELFGNRDLQRAKFAGRTWVEQTARILDELPERVYVSFDIDVLQPQYCPHTGTPVAGGLGYDEAMYLLEELRGSGRKIIGFDVVEVSPHPTSEVDASTGARVLYKLAILSI